MSHALTFSSRVIPLIINDIDTDQIIPARFLKRTDKSGMEEGLFADWRYRSDGSPNPDFILNKPESRGEILLVGDNFGCGSSREHAPWALKSFGFRAIISTSFADIFRNNSLKNSLLPIEVQPTEFGIIRHLIEDSPDQEILVDLANQVISLPDGKRFMFPIDSFSKHCLLNGVDELGYLLQFNHAITAFEEQQSVGT
jgi:3-isopropylmalate/(R)-2-methylmalate dehydratase small subunit